MATELGSLAKLLIDLAKALRTELASRKSIGPIALGVLIQLFGELTRLAADLEWLRHFLDAQVEVPDPTDKRRITATFDRIRRVCLLFRDIDLELLNLYYPGAGDATRDVLEYDMSLHAAFSRHVAPAFNIDIGTLPASLTIFLAHGHRWEDEYELPGGYRMIDTEGRVRKSIDALLVSIEPIRSLVGETIKTHWSIGELAK